ncbi:MAG: ABC transporter permease, partial [Chloroflexi bacterium]|nr:ABC transporter permease [Chloroflexota bacterium]
MLWLSSLRYLVKHPWQTGLSILGVALGVAVVVAMDLANQSAKRAFNLSTDAVAGRSTHHIIGGPDGIPSELYRDLKISAGIRNMAPVIEGYAIISPDNGYPVSQHAGRRFQVLGIDPFAEGPFRPYLSAQSAELSSFLTTPGAILMSEETADSIGLEPGQDMVISVAGVKHSVTLVGTIRPVDKVSRQGLADILIADIATAQELVGAPAGIGDGTGGRISRIDLILPEGQDGVSSADKIRSLLPPGVKLERTAARSASVDQLTRAFEVNLTALSLLALLVGTFLIYNSITFSVVMRRNVIGTFRGIGVTRRQVFALVLGEALLVGLISSGIGIVLGILLGKGLVGIVTRTINDLFFVVSVRDLAIPAQVLIKGGLLGVFATLIAAIGPAIEATQVSPRAAMTRSNIEARWRSLAPYSAIGGVVLLLLGLGLLVMPTRSLVISFGGLLFMLLGSALLVPPITVIMLKGLAPASRRPLGMLASMAARGVSASLSRTAIAIASLTIAVSITVGIGTMVQSFRGTVERWLNTTLAADIYISPPSLVSSRIHATVLPDVFDRIVSSPGIERFTTFRSVQVDSPRGPVRLVALDTDLPTFNRPRRFKEGDPAEIWEDFQKGDTVIISEPFAYHQSLGVGSTVTLRTDQGRKEFRVAGVYVDYSS